MAKYLDYSGLSYLWQKVVNNFALKINTQETLVSGSNIKTINGQSILGSGNLVVGGGEGKVSYWGMITGDISYQTDLIDKLNEKQSYLISGENIKTINGYTLLGEGNIEISSTFDPSILSSYATKDWVNEQGFLKEHQDLSSYATKDWVNEQGFIDNTVDNLINYYKKAETYTKTEVDNLISTIKSFEIKVVDVLPEASEDTMNKLYLVPAEGSSTGEKDEYITLREGEAGAYTYKWELIGSTKIDLTDYAKKSWVTDTLTSYAKVSYVESEVSRIEGELNSYASKTWVNEQGFLKEHQDLSAYAKVSYVEQEVAKKQNTLISGETIKTINGESILGSGDITITPGESGVTSFGGYTGIITIDTDNENIGYVNFKMDDKKLMGYVSGIEYTESISYDELIEILV